jgi:hypothetical protein
VLRGQPRNVELRAIAIAVTNRDVDTFAREGDMVHSRRDSKVGPLLTKSERAKERLAKIKKGEEVDGGLGKSMTYVSQ